ncbi:hypothetical protein LTT66_32385 [Nocardia gipuzkoensis]|uniref:hypothetical protein n=1 Tax=Nocardia gipuzkoensis TaxID=2749991 RepID=UPI001E5979A3|nr:hypothetical protein [Nocardia gipuzkoensis]UGT67829.1 hypothetical protein LTT66_32385 [Nocardia gipuzkoensis]
MNQLPSGETIEKAVLLAGRAPSLHNSVLSTDRDTPEDLVRCGEVLSTVLLECTLAGFATCPLTHLTEVPSSRAVVRELTAHSGLPQVLIRVGIAPESEPNAPATSRRPLSEILDIAESDRKPD